LENKGLLKNHFAKKALVLLSDPALRRSVKAALEALSYNVDVVDDLTTLENRLIETDYVLGVVDFRWQNKELLRHFKEFYPNKHRPRPRWLVVLPEGASETQESLCGQGALRSLNAKELSLNFNEVFSKALEEIEICIRDPMYEVMDILETVTGVQVKHNKRALVESRLRRRLPALNLKSIEEYVAYFLENRQREMTGAISLVTTHTTEFFREDEHFDYLFDQVFPKLFLKNKKIFVWSAASSTGQEVYSLTISLLEYMRLNNLSLKDGYKIQVLGTDIDPSSLKIAAAGIYKKEQMEGLPSELIHRYFDEGAGALSEHFRVKESVHELCRFQPLNLLNSAYEIADVDFIFLRNVMIYFKSEDVKKVVTRMAASLTPEGVLFLGHSESLSGLQTPFKKIGDSVYRLETATQNQFEKSKSANHDANPTTTPPELILIGASTGGVEALKVVLAKFPVGCAPILIVQHISSPFSAPLARRLDANCAITVKEAMDGENLRPSHAYVAPGGRQMKIRQRASKLYIEINDDPPLGRHKPSVDYLFNSVIPFAKKMKISAALLTGMGSDGARGLKLLRDVGVHTIAQDEQTSVVYGMPGVAASLEAASEILPLPEIAEGLLRGGRLKESGPKAA
jgi:chemotaxis methyl-accepting protein methylase